MGDSLILLKCKRKSPVGFVTILPSDPHELDSKIMPGWVRMGRIKIGTEARVLVHAHHMAVSGQVCTRWHSPAKGHPLLGAALGLEPLSNG